MGVLAGIAGMKAEGGDTTNSSVFENTFTGCAGGTGTIFPGTIVTTNVAGTQNYNFQARYYPTLYTADGSGIVNNYPNVDSLAVPITIQPLNTSIQAFGAVTNQEGGSGINGYGTIFTQAILQSVVYGGTSTSGLYGQVTSYFTPNPNFSNLAGFLGYGPVVNYPSPGYLGTSGQTYYYPEGELPSGVQSGPISISSYGPGAGSTSLPPPQTKIPAAAPANIPWDGGSAGSLPLPSPYYQWSYAFADENFEGYGGVAGTIGLYSSYLGMPHYQGAPFGGGTGATNYVCGSCTSTNQASFNIIPNTESVPTNTVSVEGVSFTSSANSFVTATVVKTGGPPGASLSGCYLGVTTTGVTGGCDCGPGDSYGTLYYAITDKQPYISTGTPFNLCCGIVNCQACPLCSNPPMYHLPCVNDCSFDPGPQFPPICTNCLYDPLTNQCNCPPVCCPSTITVTVTFFGNSYWASGASGSHSNTC